MATKKAPAPKKASAPRSRSVARREAAQAEPKKAAAPRSRSVARREAAQAEPKEGKGRFTITVRMNDREVIAQTDSIAEALLALRPEAIKTKVIIRAEAGGRSVEAVLFQARAKRTFQHPLAALAMEKNLRTALNAND